MQKFLKFFSVPLAICLGTGCLAALGACGGASGGNGSSGSALASPSFAYRPANVPANYVLTPNGYFDPSCIQHIQPDETVQADGTIRNAAGQVRPGYFCNLPHFDAAGREILASQLLSAPNEPLTKGWVESFHTHLLGAVKWFSATWVVPATPKAGNRGQTIFFFNGLEANTILQPVIGYENGKWTATSWHCCKKGAQQRGNTITIHPGDIINGTITGHRCTAGGVCKTWRVETLDQSTGQTSVLTTAPWGGSLGWWTIPAALEVYHVSACNQYPASGKLKFFRLLHLGGAGHWSATVSKKKLPQCGFYGRQNKFSTNATLGFTHAGSRQVSPHRRGNFSASCFNIALSSGHVLGATCYTLSRKVVSSTLNLNSCVGNAGGSLAFNRRNYVRGCRKCSLHGATMTCHCNDVFGIRRQTSLDLDARVKNCNGKLTCGPC